MYFKLKLTFVFSGEEGADRERSESFRSLETTTTTSIPASVPIERSTSVSYDGRRGDSREYSRGSSVSSDLVASPGGGGRNASQPSPRLTRRPKTMATPTTPLDPPGPDQRISRSSVASSSTRSSTSKSMSTSSTSGGGRPDQVQQVLVYNMLHTNCEIFYTSFKMQVNKMVISDQDIDEGLAASTISSSGGGGGGANTHIIKVSGPVTNLDETVVSAAPTSNSSTREVSNLSPVITSASKLYEGKQKRA